MRITVYFLPVIVVAIIVQLWVSLSPKSPPPVNQMSPLASPDNQFTMKMNIEDGYWIVSIYDKSGRQLYRDDDDTFNGDLNVYWVWDHADRLWLCNSDDGNVYYWSRTPQGWEQTCWGHEHEHQGTETFRPPETLYPDYAKEKPKIPNSAPIKSKG